MKFEIFKYIECWYNKKRRHSALANLTIEEFYNKLNLDLFYNKMVS